MKKILLILLVIILLGTVGFYLFDYYQDKNTNNSSNKNNIVNQDSNLSLSQANNQFAFKLYSQIKKNDQNILFSPYSIMDAFGMVYEGSQGDTANQIANVFQFTTNDQKRRDEFLSFQNNLVATDNLYTLRSANSLWVEKTYSVLDSYLEVIEKYYGGDAQNIDFKNNPQISRQTINQWVSNQTNNKIKDLFGEKSITEDTKLVLANAIYFKGEWINKFYPNNTHNDTFTLANGNTIDTKMMSIKNDETNFDYYEDDNLQVLKMPYVGNKLSMVLLLPKSNNLSSLEQSLTDTSLNQWQQGLTNQAVNVYLPKFTFNDKYDLVDTLKQMGITDSFDARKANFSGISQKNDLFINAVEHQVYIGVNELGTEAAAATGIGMSATSVSMVSPKAVPVFRADHPFMFLIQDDTTKTILFMGSVNNPTL